jgi:hypothetical protein
MGILGEACRYDKACRSSPSNDEVILVGEELVSSAAESV